MTTRRGSDGPDDEELRARFQEIVDDADLDALRGVAAAVLELAGERSPGPDRRRPSPAEPVLLTLRVDLEDTAVWRRLEVRGDLTLDAVHEVLQDAMGWSDGHLHQFTAGGGFADLGAQRFVTPQDVEEGEEGVLENDVRLDELLQSVGDEVRYTYDLGDGWDHVVRVEAVDPLPADAPRARCTDGRLACPPEDCGGPGGYAQLVAMVRVRLAAARAADDATAAGDDAGAAGDDAEHDEDLRWGWAFGDLTPEQALAKVEHFDPAEADLDHTGAAAAADLPGPLTELLRRLPRRADRAALLALASRADLHRPVLVDADLAAAHVEPYRWFLQHVGDGLDLTAAGYLRPADVEATARALGIAEEWIGTLNREAHTLPVLVLRETLQRLGLLRRLKGRLLPTRAGRVLGADPVRLWWHVVGRLPLERSGFDRDAALLALLDRAGGGGGSGAVVDVLRALGWAHDHGGPVTTKDVSGAVRDTEEVLRRMGVLPRGWRRDAGALHLGLDTVARAALQRWP